MTLAIDDPALGAVTDLVCALFARPRHVPQVGPISPKLVQSRLVCVIGRVQGRRVFRHWQQGPDLAANLSESFAEMHRTLGAKEMRQVTTLEVFVPEAAPFAFVDALAERPASNVVRHRFALGLVVNDEMASLAPTELTARNLSFARAFECLAEEMKVAPDQGTRVFIPGQSFLINLERRKGYLLCRGQPLVTQAEITPATVRHMADRMTDWLVRQVGANGCTTYKYWPSQGKYSDANNTIRQFMGSACLALAARRYAGKTVAAACARNFAYNFATFYEDRGPFAVINEFGKTKLGAAGVAITAILNLEDPTARREELAKLRRFVEEMQNEDGSFRTFLDPPDRNDNQFFYPGEALLALIMLYERDRDPELLRRVKAGFGYYRAFFRADRNPAFVPWHTQAYCLLHDQTDEAEVADFVFEMNDWLLGMQETGTDAPEIRGDFFDPSRPEYGPPHASATGVYLEGLIEAWRLARKLGDAARAEAYRRSIVLGLRMLRQLQFRAPEDMFYSTRRERIEGGLRTAIFDNTIRIDNVQHGLMAIYRVLDRFAPEDFEV